MTKRNNYVLQKTFYTKMNIHLSPRTKCLNPEERHHKGQGQMINIYILEMPNRINANLFNNINMKIAYKTNTTIEKETKRVTQTKGKNSNSAIYWIQRTH